MKSYSRIGYGGESLPERARVVSFLIADGADVELGTVSTLLTPDA